jgi:predicted HicB family RNase H-like nuclease
MILDYKGFVAEVELDEDGDFHGRVINTQDVINFYGQTAGELQAELAKSIESYLAFCKARGREPEKPYSGKFIIRLDPSVHRALALRAARHGKSLNSFVVERLERGLGSRRKPSP